MADSLLFRSAAMPVTPLDATETLALEGMLKERHGRYELDDDVRTRLRDYFVGKGRGGTPRRV